MARPGLCCLRCPFYVILVCCFISTITGSPRIIARFNVNPLNNEGSALLLCEVYDLGDSDSYYVTIDRTIFDKTERLYDYDGLLPRVADNIRVSFRNGDPPEYALSIRGVYHQIDAGVYTCKVLDLAQNVINSDSATLQINHFPADFNPRCTISGFDKSLIRSSGSQITLGCYTDLGFPPVEPPVWSYNSCNGYPRSSLLATLTSSGAYYSELAVTLNDQDNGGSFICTISRADGTFSQSCTFGTFTVSGGTDCGSVATTTTRRPIVTTLMALPGLPLTTIPTLNPRIIAYFDLSTIDNGYDALLICGAYDLGSRGNYFVTIERTISSIVEPLFEGTVVLASVPDNIDVLMFGETSKTFTLSITGAHYQTDAGTYTCRILDMARNVIDSASATLQINHLPASYNPSCSILDVNTGLTRQPGSQIILSCYSDLGYPPVEPPVWSYTSCNGDGDSRAIPEATLTESWAYFSELKVTLTGEDNGGSFFCSIRNVDGTYSRSCTVGAFTIIGGRHCGVTTLPPTTSALPVIPPTVQAADPYITAFFQTNPIENNKDTILICQAYNLRSQGTYVVTIERLVYPNSNEVLLVNEDISPSVLDKFDISVSGANPKQYHLFIRRVNHHFDAGTYTCNILDRSGIIVTSASSILQIFHLPADYNPSCSISDEDKSLTRPSGSQVSLSCYSDFGYPPVESPTWSYIGCNGNSRQLPEAWLSDSDAYFSVLKVTLSNEDDGGRFICTIRSSDGAFSRDCTVGAFIVIGGTTCGAATSTTQILPTVSPSGIPTTIQHTVPRITASFDTNPLDNDDNAFLTCTADGLGTEHDYFVTIERTVSSNVYPLFEGTVVLASVPDNIDVSIFDETPRTYSLSITGVHHQTDAGTYTCRILDTARNVIHLASATLMINHLPASYNPSCSILDVNTGLTRQPGSPIVLSCYSDLGYPPVEPPVWSYTSCNGDGGSRIIPEATLTESWAYFSELQVTLTGEDNGGSFFCSIRNVDGTFSRSCTVGAFTIIGGRHCGVTTLPPTTSALPVIPPTIQAADPYIIAFFETNPIENDKGTILICQAYNLRSQGDYVVTIERLVYPNSNEVLLVNEEISPSVADKFDISVSGENPKQYHLFIRRVNHNFDAGTYTCNILDLFGNVVTSASSILQIIHLPAEYNPSCSISDEDKSLTRSSGIQVSLSCYSDFGYPPVESPTWSYIGCNGNSRQLPEAWLSDSEAYFSVLKVTLSNEDNGGRFICTIRSSDGAFSRDCTVGAFTVIGGTACGAATSTTRSLPTVSPSGIPTTIQHTVPRITASFDKNPLNNADNAFLTCTADGLRTEHDYFVTIERTIFGQIESELLFEKTDILSHVADNFQISVYGDRPVTFVLSIRDVSHLYDAGIYTCKILDQTMNLIHSASATLNVNHLPADSNPTVSISGSDNSLIRLPGSQVVLGCYSDFGYPPIDLPVWSSLAGCNGNSIMLPAARVTDSGTYYNSEIRVTLSVDDNGRSFVCSISRPDGSFSKNSTMTFSIIGGKECDIGGIESTTQSGLTTVGGGASREYSHNIITTYFIIFLLQKGI